MTEFQRQINNKNITKTDFPIGCRVYIDYISDDSYPADVTGKHATVTYVDDASQVTCRLDDGRTVTVCREYGDKFFKVKEA